MKDSEISKKAGKIQITLPLELIKKIDEEIKQSYTKKSMWFLKIVEEYFESKERNQSTKKSINLKI